MLRKLRSPQLGIVSVIQTIPQRDARGRALSLNTFQ